MHTRPTASLVEKKIGLEQYLTDTDPLGGFLKNEPEDFIVNEISDAPIENTEGDYIVSRITSRNWETNRMIRFFSKRLKISRNKIKFAGTKDKRAITTQLISFPAKNFNKDDMEIPDINVLHSYRSNREMELGTLFGNEFKIRVNNISISHSEIEDNIKLCCDQLFDEGGFPNFFGIQRFGAIRPITHIVGERIVKKDIKGAVMAYLGSPKGLEESDIKEARTRVEKDMDFEEALEYFPSTFIFERTLLYHLKRNPDDWAGSLNQLPDNLRMMFVHAYQSYLFNRILSERMRQDIPLGKPQIGDIVIPLNKKGLPNHREHNRVTSSNLPRMDRLVSRKKAFISGLIVGLNCEFSNGEIGEIERKIIENEKIEPEDFLISEVRKVSSKGIRREILSPIFDFKWRKDIAIKDSVEFSFSLFKGTYATSLMREFIKGEVTDY